MARSNSCMSMGLAMMDMSSGQSRLPRKADALAEDAGAVCADRATLDVETRRNSQEGSRQDAAKEESRSIGEQSFGRFQEVSGRTVHSVPCVRAGSGFALRSSGGLAPGVQRQAGGLDRILPRRESDGALRRHWMPGKCHTLISAGIQTLPPLSVKSWP